MEIEKTLEKIYYFFNEKAKFRSEAFFFEIWKKVKRSINIISKFYVCFNIVRAVLIVHQYLELISLIENKN